jgi:hypothetical protein
LPHDGEGAFATEERPAAVCAADFGRIGAQVPGAVLVPGLFYHGEQPDRRRRAPAVSQLDASACSAQT